jgi:hypothetical protein
VTTVPLEVTVLGPPDSLAVTVQVSPVDGARFAVRLAVTCVAAAPVVAGLRVEWRLGPTDDPGWLVPGVLLLACEDFLESAERSGRPSPHE